MMGGGFGWGFPGLGMLLVWGLIIVLLVWLVRSLFDESAPPGETAGQILDERFARGEIDRQEYEDKQSLLGERDR